MKLVTDKLKSIIFEYISFQNPYADMDRSRGKAETSQGQKKFAIILPKNRDTAIFNRLYITLYIKFVANTG